MGAAAIGMMVGGAFIQAAGARQQALATQAEMNYKAQVARNDQILAEQAAQASEARGGRLAQFKELETAGRMGAITASEGAAGLDPTSGSALRLQADTKAMGELDARTIRYNAAREAYGFRVQGTSYGAQATLDELTGREAMKAGNLQEIGSFIGAGAQVSDKWAQYKSAGVIGGPG